MTHKPLPPDPIVEGRIAFELAAVEAEKTGGITMTDTNVPQAPDADKGSPFTGKGMVDAMPPNPESWPGRSPGEPVTGFGRGVPPPEQLSTGLGEPEGKP